MDEIITSVTASLIVAAVSVVCGWLVGRLRQVSRDVAAERERRERREEIVDGALRALLFDKLARLHADTVEQGKPAGVEVKQRADVAWSAYRALNPDDTLDDGTAAHLHAEIIDVHAAGDPE
ncbi:hypothetical protein [Bifidobacterium stellenboschense]|uniref:Phage minor structural protein n=1 Tax=Bifidobacterium stellenboschense TaxID=762211 RepID=A0A087DQJ6_9BIFI|nr:hypothetical protein [Bifidobacterium stellenboschense]KFI97796.1 hypothetical protein BSTEL_0607 [Bifidobacterium stellenboschense]